MRDAELFVKGRLCRQGLPSAAIPDHWILQGHATDIQPVSAGAQVFQQGIPRPHWKHRTIECNEEVKAGSVELGEQILFTQNNGEISY